MLLQELANRIRSQREKRGLKQQDLANALQVSPQAVSKWERSENAPDIALLGKLATLLGVSVDWLLGRNDPRQDVFEATVLASSVLGAFEKSLAMEPRDFAAWANGLFYQLTEAVLRHEGVPIKYMGDQFLCFFSGAERERRALEAARLARRTISEALKIGLASGPVYLGAVGHPDYARPDVMGETVNAAFLTMQWAETHASSGVAATAVVVEAVGAACAACTAGVGRKVRFHGIRQPVTVHEIALGA
jgi:class 3 adenylate cyclase